MKAFRGFSLKAKARIWPGLSCVCHIRSVGCRTISDAALSSRCSSVMFYVRLFGVSGSGFRIQGSGYLFSVWNWCSCVIFCVHMVKVPLPIEYGTHQTVQARFWFWISGKSSYMVQISLSQLGTEGFGRISDVALSRRCSSMVFCVGMFRVQAQGSEFRVQVVCSAFRNGAPA